MKGFRFKALILTTIFVSVADGVADLILYYLSGGHKAQNVFKFIASGIFGFKAFAGGSDIVIFGILFHFLIAFLWVSFFFVVYPLFKIKGNTIFVGTIYGIIIWLVMSFVVIPISNAPSPPNDDVFQIIISVLVIVLTGGIPIAWAHNSN
ncbi:hypothetical protein [Marinoscillum sp. MHG1-6]|uniref:hypothetical protein n=1 Tax=Marinoscillum sp. MHG1-6 TaxID=2959627 RepID=UPI00215857AD|nr:hypothetical protein [Marinoscillum sp. MHG1-6]